MKIRKVINNNVVSSVDEKGREVIVMGKGIGFQKKTGDVIPKDKIEKIYKLNDEQQSQFIQLVKDIPYEHLKLATTIISDAREFLGCRLNRSIYITLTDHLSFAIDRAKQGIDFNNALLWEIKKYYPKEYTCGKRALEIVKKETGIQLSDNEACSIALHILNAEVDGDIAYAMLMPELVKEILNIIRYNMMIDFDEDSLNYERLVTHLKYFVQRAVKGEYYESSGFPTLFESIKEECQEEYTCSLKIKKYMEQKTNYTVSEEELLYLTLHINRVKRRLIK